LAPPRSGSHRGAVEAAEGKPAAHDTRPGVGPQHPGPFGRGHLQSSQSKTGVTTIFQYDALDGRTQVIDPRTGATVTAYNAWARQRLSSIGSLKDGITRAVNGPEER